MTDPSHCSLEVIRVAHSQRNTNDARLYMKIKVGKLIRKTCEIDGGGRPTWNDTSTFPRMDPSTVFNISLRKSRRLLGDELVGRADITVARLQGGSAEHEVRLSRMRSGRPEHAATVRLYYREIDALSRAAIDVEVAGQCVERIKNSGETSESAIAVIGSVREAVDTVVEIVDKVAEIHPVFEVSWKAASALYKLVSQQYENDMQLIGMVGHLRDALDFTSVAKDLKDDGNVIRPKLRELLDETARCSEFVQGYVTYPYAVRMVRIRDKGRIDEFTGRFFNLRRELDSVTGATTAKVVDEVRQQQMETKKEVTDTNLRQQLEYHLSPLKSDASNVSRRTRCLKGTREEYLGRIMDFLSLDSTANVLWLTGAAGSGKSTIAVTTSDRCDEMGCNAAYIFFERGKSEPNSVIRTIAYRLSMLYPSIASHVAKAVSANKNTVGNTLKKQFEVLLLDPLNAITITEASRVVIILDALDECGSVEERRDLLQVLKNDLARLPSKVRILVTSRPEGDIMEEQASAHHIEYISLKHDSDKGRADVGEYMNKEMFEVVKGKAPKGREWNDIYRSLTDAAGGLFIWASTAVKMVERSMDPSKKLGTLLDDIQAVGNYGIDSLYTTAIKESGIPWDDSDAREVFRLVVGLVVEAKEGMSAEVIAAFLGCDEAIVDRLLSRLRSVLFYEQGQSVRLHHASFADYLLSEKSSRGQSWHIDKAGQRLAIAERCFDVMTGLLRFNICDIESSFGHNKDILDLHERIRKNAPPHLDYACRFWAAHVCELPRSVNLTLLLAKLKAFSETRVLYWFEVLSLTGNFNRVAIRALLEMTLWTAPIDPDFSSFFCAAHCLANEFSFPISQSVPQIYLSAVTFWRGECRVADHYSRTHPCLPIQRYGTKPPEQCMRVIEERKHWIISVAFSPDGKRAVSGSVDGSVRILDTDTDELVLGPLWGHTDHVRSVAFSLRDGKLVVSGSSDKTIRIWDAVTGELVSGPFEGHENWVTSVAFSQDGTRVLSGSRDTTIRIWDVLTAKLVSGPFNGHTDWVNSVGFSADGTRVVSGSNDKTMRIWNVKTGAVITVEGHTHEVMSVAFSTDGGRVVSADMTIRVWDAETGQLVAGPFKGHTRSIGSVAFSPDGNFVVSGSDDTTVRIWASNTGDLVACPFKGHTLWVISVAFSLDGKQVVSASGDRTVRIWDVDSGTVSPGLLNSHESLMHSAGFSANGKRAVSGFRNGTICVWDTDSREPVSDAFGHAVTLVALSADGRFVVSGSDDGTVRVWNASSGELVSGPLECKWVCSVALSREGNRVASGSKDETIRIWDAASGELFSGPLEGHTGRVGSVAFSPDGSLVVSGSDDNTFGIWNAVSGALVSGPFQGHTRPIVSAAFSPNGDRVVSGSVDRTIRIWNATTGKTILGPLEGHTDWVRSVAFSSDGKRVVSGSDDKTVRVWDAVSGQLISTFYGHGDAVLSVAFSTDRSYIYSGSRDGTIRMWYASDGDVMHRRISEHSEIRSSSSIDPGRTLYTGQVAEVPSPGLHETRAITNWTLTEDGWVIGENGELLTWVPEDMRTTLWQARNTILFGCQFSTRLDFSNAPVGQGWYKGFPLQERCAR